MKQREHDPFGANPESVSDLLKLGLDETLGDDGAPPAGDTTHIGPYTVSKLLGRGGMGEVWRAIDPSTQTTVAVKYLKSELAFDPSAVHRFQTESRHMAGLSHPHIVKVLSAGEHEGRPYYVTPLYSESLATRLARSGPLSETEALRIAYALADALAYAHQRGITHRDLKPANVMMDESGHPYLCDFGLVRTVFNDSILNVQERKIEGTIAYMSPATAFGQAEDTRCDIYGWGAILYEMLAGRPPYVATRSDALLAAVRAGPPQAILAVNPKASVPLARVAEWAMARELRDRYAEMRDILRDLDRIRAGQMPVGPHGTAKRHHRLLVLGASLAAVMVVLFVGFLLAQKKNKSSVQDRAVARVVQDEPQTLEDEKMKMIAMTITATALAAQVSLAEPAVKPVSQPTGGGSLVTLTAPYPQPEPGSPPGDKISLQYAVLEIAQQAGLGYQFNESQRNVGETARKWVYPNIRNVSFAKAMDSLLLPHGIGYEVVNGSVTLIPGITKRVSLTKPYPKTYSGAPVDKISLQYAVLEIAKQAGLGYQFNQSQANVGDVARRWTTPALKNVPFADAMRTLLDPFGLTYQIVDKQVILQK